jgi:hypothetical protein
MSAAHSQFLLQMGFHWIAIRFDDGDAKSFHALLVSHPTNLQFFYDCPFARMDDAVRELHKGFRNESTS